MYNAVEVAEYVIRYCKQHRYFVSNLKLQKILYFIQANFLVELQKSCFCEEIEAWDFGPVIPEVYKAYRMFGNASIPYLEKSEIFQSISEKDKKYMDEIIEKCSEYSTSELVAITHRQTPWMEAYQKYYHNIISKEAIRDYFKDNKRKR